MCCCDIAQVVRLIKGSAKMSERLRKSLLDSFVDDSKTSKWYVLQKSMCAQTLKICSGRLTGAHGVQVSFCAALWTCDQGEPSAH